MAAASVERAPFDLDPERVLNRRGPVFKFAKLWDRVMCPDSKGVVREKGPRSCAAGILCPLANKAAFRVDSVGQRLWVGVSTG